MEITPSQIRCLLVVLALSETYEHIESKDVAHLLGIKKPTAHRTLGILQEKSLIDKEHYGDVLGEMIFNLLVLVGAVKMSDRVVREMFGL